jgi:drug/metabolite transporter (DMT)-like permease
VSAPESKRTLLADAALLGITALWGATFVTVKDALDDADTLTFLALRFSLGGLAASLMAGRSLFSALAWKRGFVLGLLLFGGYLAQTKGLETTTPSRSAFVTGLCVLFVPIFSWMFYGSRPSKWVLLGSLLALLGLLILTGNTSGFTLFIGDWLTLICAFLFGIHIALTQKFALNVAPTALVASQLLTTAILAAFSLHFSNIRINPGIPLYVAIAVTGILASAVAISIQAWAQTRTSAVRAALFFSLEPIFAIIWSAIIGRGVPQAHEWIGGFIMIAGVVVAEMAGVWATRTK